MPAHDARILGARIHLTHDPGHGAVHGQHHAAHAGHGFDHGRDLHDQLRQDRVELIEVFHHLLQLVADQVHAVERVENRSQREADRNVVAVFSQ